MLSYSMDNSEALEVKAKDFDEILSVNHNPDEMEIKDQISDFLNGQANAMDTIIETYKNPLYGLCFKLTLNNYDADDLFQQTWLKAAKAISGFRNGSFKSWLFAICINQYKDNYRMMMKRKQVVKDDFATTNDKENIITNSNIDNSMEVDYEKKHTYTILANNIARLASTYKIPIILHYYEDMKYKEIALILDIPEGTVKSRINTGKQKLRQAMEDELNV